MLGLVIDMFSDCKKVSFLTVVSVDCSDNDYGCDGYRDTGGHVVIVIVFHIVITLIGVK